MPFTKSSPPPGKKQAVMPGPNSAAYKKLLAATKGSAQAPAKAALSKAGKKRRKFSPALSMKSRQMIVERVKRAIWASVLEINDAIINLALCGNYNAAKALFDFAGVYSMPAPDDENAIAAPAPASAPAPEAEAASPSAIDAFFRSIGVQPPRDEPAPGVAA